MPIMLASTDLLRYARSSLLVTVSSVTSPRLMRKVLYTWLICSSFRSEPMATRLEELSASASDMDESITRQSSTDRIFFNFISFFLSVLIVQRVGVFPEKPL